MAHFQVFVPEAFQGDRVTSHPLADVGLPDFVAGADGLAIAAGPDGGRGTLYAWRSPTNRRLHFNAAEQTWLPATGYGGTEEGRYWVGLWNDAPPSEADLRRPALLFGGDVTLGNGEAWHVATPTELPHTLLIEADGSLRMEPLERYQAVCVEAYRWRRILSCPNRMVPFIDMHRFAMKCLSLNYRLPVEVANHLKLIHSGNVRQVMFAAMGVFGGEDRGSE